MIGFVVDREAGGGIEKEKKEERGGRKFDR
jgi:hypothetical protein